MSKKPDGGPAFPLPSGPTGYDGISLRDWFATHAPLPSDDRIGLELESDRARNPHGDYHKPKRRSRTEIIADLAYDYADAMLEARNK